MRYSRALGATPYISTLETKPSPYIPQQTIVVRISLLVGDWTGGRVGIGFSWTRKGWNWVQGVWPGMNWKRHEESFSCFGRLNAFPFAWFPGSTRLLTPTRPGGLRCAICRFRVAIVATNMRSGALARSAPIVFEAGRRISASEYPQRLLEPHHPSRASHPRHAHTRPPHGERGSNLRHTHDRGHAHPGTTRSGRAGHRGQKANRCAVLAARRSREK